MNLRNRSKVENILNPDEIPLIDPSIAPNLYRWQAKLLESKINQLKQKDIKLKQALSKIKKLKNNKWYRFGKLSRNRKIWAAGKALSKKMKIHRALKPIAQVVKQSIKKSK